MGGALAAIERGWIQNEIGDSAYKAQRSLEDGSSVVVGVNRFVEESGVPLPLLVIDESVERDQLGRLGEFRRRREADAAGRRGHREALARLDAAAKADRNLLSPILDAIRNDATVGEITGTLKDTFGAHRDQVF